jgi:N-acetylneuraminic acid mutarotase
MSKFHYNSPEAGLLSLALALLPLAFGLFVVEPVKAFTLTNPMTNARDGHTATRLPNGKVLVAGGSDSVQGALRSAELYDPLTGTWAATGPLISARYGHTATLLGNGQVLVVGGITNSSGGESASAELYNPATGAWTATGSLIGARSEHTATLLINGKVLVAGGFDLDSAELYDPAAGTWAATGTMTNTHYSHTATLLPDGQVLVAGGDGSGGGSSTETYDPTTGAWTSTGDMVYSRTAHTATLLPNGQVLVAGGGWYGFGFNATPTAELYNPATGTWTETGTMVSSGRFSHTATLLTNGLVLVAGGAAIVAPLSSTELYDPNTGTWTAAGNMTTNREAHTATLLPNGQVLFAGGIGGLNSSSLSNAELYDPRSIGTWRDTGPLGTASDYHTATLLPNGKVLVAGGTGQVSTNFVTLDLAELYDSTTETWTVTGPMNYARELHTATLLSKGQVLVAGGLDFDSGDSTWSAELYDTGAGTWTETGLLNEARYFHTATLLPNGNVLVAGGFFVPGSPPLSSAELFDPATGTWTLTGSMNVPRGAHTATLLPSGKVLVVGGGSLMDTNFISSAELYDPATGLWTLTGSLGDEPGGHTATLLPNSKVLVAGGSTGSSHSVSTVKVYDPATETWTTTGPMAFDREQHTAILLPDGRVLVAGGFSFGFFFQALASAEVYDPATGGWTAAAWLGSARGGHTATLLTNGLILAVGGNSGISPLSSAELFDFGPLPVVVTPPILANAHRLVDGSFQFSFTNSPGASFTVLASSNPALPLISWSVLGAAIEVSSGRFQFTDTQATNFSKRSYGVRSP